MTLELVDHEVVPHATRVRRAEPSDAGVLEQLHGEATSERLAHRGGEVLVASVRRGADGEEARRSFARLIDDDQVEVLVAELAPRSAERRGGAVAVGHAVIRLAASAPLTREVAVIEELYVTPRARTVGVGSMLLEDAKSMATERGCSGLDAIALPGDRSTKNFFEDHAMVARAIVVHCELDPERDSDQEAR